MTPPANRAPGEDEQVRALEARIEELVAQLAEDAERAAGARRRLERDLDRALRQARDRDRALVQARTDLAKLQSRRVVRIGLASVRVLRRPLRAVRRVVDRSRAATRRVALGLRPRALLPRGPRLSEHDLVARLIAALPPAPAASGRISVIVESRSDTAALRDCLDGLEATDWDDLEIFVAGTGADNQVRVATRGDQRSHGGQRRIRPVTGGTAADSRREAVALATGELVLFLHDDVRPVEPGWLTRMVATLRQEGAGAVGARLLLPVGAGDRSLGIRELTTAHLGLEFVPVEGLPEPRPIGLGTNPLGPDQAGRLDRPAASEACLLMTRATLDSIGLPPGEREEPQPVELCLRIREGGRRIVVDGDALLWHRHALAEARPALVTEDVSGLVERWGPALWRAVFRDRLLGRGRWSSVPLRVGITLTKDDETAGYGDWYTAHELGAALGALGFEVGYLEREKDRWYEAAGSYDVIVSLLEKFDLFRIPRHVVTVAWIRNWTEEWIAKPWFANYDIVLASSGPSKAIVEERSAKIAHLFPIATNPGRFHPRQAIPELATDAVFVGSNWGVQRGVAAALPDLVALGHRVAIYGRGWEDRPGLEAVARGLIAYDAVPDVYASSSIAIDDAAISTKPYGSLNSRVFDALATGTLVLTDNVMGARELFDDEFPTWTEPEDLVATLNGLLQDPERRTALADRYRQVILERHTYEHRAAELQRILGDWAAAPKVAVHIGPTTWEIGLTWGDVPFGRDVQRNLERRGYPTSILVHDEQTSAASMRADIALHIFGVRAPRVFHSQLNALWVISHPDRITESLCDSYDIVFLASDTQLQHLERRVSVPLVGLHQATEPARFYPEPTGPRHQLLFIGNSRGVQRPIIEDLRGTSWDLAVYGGGWTPELLDPARLKGEWVANDELRTYYSSAAIVLNDHWGDMRDLGIISNRVYDALASGAFVVSDRVPGIDAEFDGAVATYETRDELLAILERYLADDEGRRAAAATGRAAVLARHTFAQRVDRILGELEPMLDSRRISLDDAN